MVQKNFSIYGDAATAARLYAELGSRYMACWSITETGKVLHSFEMFIFNESDAWEFDELLRIISLQSKLFEQSFLSTTVIWNNNPAVVVPGEFYRDDLAAGYLALESGYGFAGSIKKEPVDKLVVAYDLPGEFVSAISLYFPAAQHVHKKSLLYGSYSKNYREEKHIADLAFYNNEVSLLLINNGNVLLQQSFAYSNAADVLYHLFNCMRHAGVPEEEVTVCVGGLIDTGSALYKELAMYITSLRLNSIDAANINKQVFTEYPSHYFSPFYSLSV